LEIDVGKYFPLVVNRRNGPNNDSRVYTFSLGCTLISVGEMAQGGEWSRLNNLGQAFLRVYTFSPGCTLISVGGMARGGEWSRLNNQGHAFLRVYTFSPGCTLIIVVIMAQGGEWSRFRRQDSYSSFLEKNSPDIFEARYSFRSHRCE
jgi:hypothetical protein